MIRLINADTPNSQNFDMSQVVLKIASVVKKIIVDIVIAALNSAYEWEEEYGGKGNEKEVMRDPSYRHQWQGSQFLQAQPVE